MATTVDPAAPIGVFDSGLGGLTVAAALTDRLPTERLVYLGDTARVPYGTRGPDTIRRYADAVARCLRRRQVKLLVAACNTVSAYAMHTLSEGDTPVVGVIEPGARAAVAASKGGAIAVLGTPATVASEAYARAVHALDPERKVHQIACPLLVPLAEEGWFEHRVTHMVAREYLAPLADTGVDTIILGCTHYPLLRSALRAAVDILVGPEVAMVDSATATADDVAALLAAQGMARRGPPTPPTVLVTDRPGQADAVARRFWGTGRGALPPMVHVDLQDEQS